MAGSSVMQDNGQGSTERYLSFLVYKRIEQIF